MRFIGPDAAVSSTSGIGPHISNRRKAYHWPTIHDADFLVINVRNFKKDDDKTCHAAVADGSLFTRPALLRQLSALNGRLLPELTELQSHDHADKERTHDTDWNRLHADFAHLVQKIAEVKRRYKNEFECLARKNGKSAYRFQQAEHTANDQRRRNGPERRFHAFGDEWLIAAFGFASQQAHVQQRASREDGMPEHQKGRV